MSDCFDHEADAWDSLMTGQDDGYGGECYYDNKRYSRPKSNPKRSVCKYCGTPNLEWSKVEGRWRLRDQDTHEMHICDPEEREWYQKNDTMDAYLNQED